MKGPFSYELVGKVAPNFRVRDAEDNRIATCFDEGNAKFIVSRLNAAGDMLAACEAALKYDAAIAKRAEDGELVKIMPEGAIAEGADLDELYADWINKVRAALSRAKGQ